MEQNLTVNKQEATLLTLLIVRALITTEDGIKNASNEEEKNRWIAERELINGLKKKIDPLEVSW